MSLLSYSLSLHISRTVVGRERDRQRERERERINFRTEAYVTWSFLFIPSPFYIFIWLFLASSSLSLPIWKRERYKDSEEDNIGKKSFSSLLSLPSLIFWFSSLIPLLLSLSLPSLPICTYSCALLSLWREETFLHWSARFFQQLIIKMESNWSHGS